MQPEEVICPSLVDMDLLQCLSLPIIPRRERARLLERLRDVGFDSFEMWSGGVCDTNKIPLECLETWGETGERRRKRKEVRDNES
jgi:hypothetical protein